MIPAAFAIPGDIDLPTGGYTYDRRVLALLPSFGVAARHVALPGSFPEPTAGDIDETTRILSAIAPGVPLMIDGLAYGAMPADLINGLHSPIIALVHHPLCLEAGLPEPRQRQLYASEKAALALAQCIVTVSRASAETLASDFGVPAGVMTVAEPGTDRAERAAGGNRPLQLLAVGSVVPRKAYDILVRALAPLKDRDWRLSIVGATDRSVEALAALQAAIGATELADRVIIAGPVDQDALAAYYAAADAFLMPSLYEGYGMVLAEAMARGLPIVCTTGGAAADTAPDDAAIKVPPGDVDALSGAIGHLLGDAGLRAKMSDASWAAGQKLPGWDDTAGKIAAVIREIAA